MTSESERGKANPGLLIGLCLLALVFLLLTQHGCWLTGLGWRFDGWHGPFWLFPPFSFVGVWVLIQLVLAVWVGADASRRGQSGLLWGLLVFFTSVVGLLVYLIAVPMLERNGTARAAPAPAPSPSSASGARDGCPECGTALEADFKVCPGCGAAVPPRCECGRRLRAGWKLCPYCGRPVAGADPDGTGT